MSDSPPPPPAETPSNGLANALHALAMNTPCNQPGDAHAAATGRERWCYKLGHCDARHAIAGALLSHPGVAAFEKMVEALNRAKIFEHMKDLLSEGNRAASYLEVERMRNDALALAEGQVPHV